MTGLCVCFVSESTFYVVEGSRVEQSEPVLQRKPLHGPVGADHQPARTMNLHAPGNPARGLASLLKSGVNPDGHIATQRSNSSVPKC